METVPDSKVLLDLLKSGSWNKNVKSDFTDANYSQEILSKFEIAVHHFHKINPFLFL